MSPLWEPKLLRFLTNEIVVANARKKKGVDGIWGQRRHETEKCYFIKDVKEKSKAHSWIYLEQLLKVKNSEN